MPETGKKRREIRIGGVVQGVGFRPFVYGLTRRLELVGYVLNTTAGVVAEVEGGEAALNSFVRALHVEAPPLARIERARAGAAGCAGRLVPAA
jgi:hydrogenase maturation protein HypF